MRNIVTEPLLIELIDSNEGYDYFVIMYNDQQIGHALVNLYSHLDNIFIDLEYRGKGIGKEAYRRFNEIYPNLKSDSENRISEEARRVWESLVKSNEVVLTDNTYMFIN